MCGTDREIAAGEYGWAPAGSDRLVLGHESLGRVRTAPPGSDFAQWTVEADYAVKLDPRLAEAGVLMEPTSVVAGRRGLRGRRRRHQDGGHPGMSR